MTQQNANIYLQKQIESASPAQQIVMLYDGAIKFYLKAKQAIEEGDIEARFNNNQRAGDIITYLLDTLDTEKGGEVAHRLSRIYTYILTRQVMIDVKNDPEIVDEIVTHLKTLRKSWEEILRKGAEQAQAEAVGEKAPEPEEKSEPIPPHKRNAIA